MAEGATKSKRTQDWLQQLTNSPKPKQNENYFTLWFDEVLTPDDEEQKKPKKQRKYKTETEKLAA